MDQKREPPELSGEQLEGEVLALFPTPGAAERVWLVEALVGIRRSLPWLDDYFGGESDFQLLQGLLDLWRDQVPPEQRQLQHRPFKGDFDAAGIMVGDHAATQALGLQVLRGLFWLVLRQKRRSGQPTSSAIRDLAATLRAARAPTTSAAGALGGVLPALGRARSIDESIEALSPLAGSTHQTLSEFWTGWLLPALKLLVTDVPVRKPTPPSIDPPNQPRVRRPKVLLPADEEEERVETADGPRVSRLIRSKPFDGQLPHEPAEEFGDSTYLVTVPGKGVNLPESLARFYAQRAIWTGNGHLLTNHVDVLLPDVFGLVLRNIVDRLENTSSNSAVALGGLGCLLKALGGRTTAGIKAFRIGESGHMGPIGGGILDVDEGLMWIPVFWKSEPESFTGGQPTEKKGPLFAHFTPSPAQRELLYPVTDRMALPLPWPVRSVFRMHKKALETLTQTSVQVLDQAMANLIANLKDELAIPITIGGLRRSLGPLVMEQSGDQAMAQLICGESIGRTMAPLSYYSPKMKAVAEIYDATLSEHLGPAPVWRIPAQATRIGSELLVTPGTAVLLASSSARYIADHASGFPLQAKLVQAHRAIADHLSRMILATTGHRPSEALFELTQADFDLGSGAALFWDKRNDRAHDPRLACVARIVADQIRAYLDHIQFLQHQIPSLSKKLEEVLQGRRPLLFDLDSAGTMVRPTLAEVAARSPDEWRKLPWNWSRTWIRTTAVEAGAPAFLVAAQLGHFDSIGYPYSNQSPTEPLDVVIRTRPWLDKLAKRQGWTVMQSELAKDSPCLAPRELPPLSDWRLDIANSKNADKKAQQKWVQRLKVERHQLRAESLAAILSHPLLFDSGLAVAHEDPTIPVRPEAIDDLDIERVREDLVIACGDDAIAAAARIRALNGVSRRLSKRADVSPPLLPMPIAVRRPLDNPFFQGACLALTQITALRIHVKERSKERAPKRTFELQVGRTVEALILFAGIEDPDTVRMLMEARTKAMPSAKIIDLVFVPVADGRSVALRGIAALALLALASEFPDEPLPSDIDIADALQTLLPHWVVDEGTSHLDLLSRLCSTAEVSNRFEYSPASRFAMDPAIGSIHASIEEQIAFIDADPVAPERLSSTKGNTAPVSRFVHGNHGGTAAYKSTARSQYASLCALIPQKGKELSLPLTAITIPATSIQTEKTRDHVIEELQAWLALPPDRDGLRPVVRMLGEWTLAEAQRRSSKGRRLADKSVATYLTRIGSALVQVLGELELEQWDEKVLEDAYAFALAASEDSKHKVASALLSFHHYCEFRFDLPDADLGDVYAALRSSKRGADASMILPVERDQALAWLREKAWEVPSDEHVARRARLAEVVGIFVARTGARISEPLGVKVADLGRRPTGDVQAIFRSNRMRALKTEAGRRSNTFEAATPEETDRIWSWRESVRRHAPSGRAGSAFITAELEDSHAFGEHSAVIDLIRSELARATGRPSERLHRLRHLKAQESLLAVALSADDAVALNLAPFAEARTLQPRDFAAVSVPLGHSHWMTTIQWYLHMPWVLQSRAAARLSQKYFGRQAIAGALGYTPAFFDNLLREGAEVSPKIAWFNRFRVARTPPQRIEPLPIHTRSTWIWTARRVARLLTEARRCKDLESAVRLTGAPLETAHALTRCAGRWERKLGRRLLPEFVGGVQREAPGVALRRQEGDSAIEILWDTFDQGNTQVRKTFLQVCHAMFSELIPGDGETLMLPQFEADQLHQLLVDAGIQGEHVRMEKAPHDMIKLSVHRAAIQSTSEISVPYGIRRVLSVIGIAAQLQDVKSP